MLHLLDRRPILVAVAGPNGAGKTTFYFTHLQQAGLRLVNADILARELGVSPYDAADVAGSIRRGLLDQRESFVFETVFSDPAGDKLSFLKQANEMGYTVLMCFIGIGAPETSEERVAMRVSQGGHDVPSEKIFARFPRVLSNLKAAIDQVPNIWIFDNSQLNNPFRLMAVFEHGQIVQQAKRSPDWLRPLLLASHSKR